MKTIPFSPPRIDQRTIDAVTEVLRSGWITTGPKTRELENQIAGYTGASKVLCLNSWTNAAELALRWFGIGPGDEVIVPVYTYAASANVIVHTGATPVFVDCAPGSFLCDTAEVERAITSRTKAIMPVDIGGYPANYDRLNAIVRSASAVFRPSGERQERLGRPLLFSDAAHSFGARIKGQVSGGHADIVGYSFHAVKNLTTAEGGALALNLPPPFENDQVWKELNISGLHGQTKDALSKMKAGQWQYDIIEPGYKCNLTDIQAAIGLVELARYEDETLPRRRHICHLYNELFAGNDWAIIPSFSDEVSESSFHLYMLRINGLSEIGRNEVIQKVAEKGISLNVHFQPLGLLTYYRSIGLKAEDYPNALAQYINEISLPVYYDLTDEDVRLVAEAVIEVVNQTI